MILNRSISSIFAFFLLGLSAAHAQEDHTLTTTLLDHPAPGEEVRLAVSWGGKLPARVRIWADFDENGLRDVGETLARDVVLNEAITVITGRIPASAPAGLSRERVKAELQRNHNGLLGADCEWASGFEVADLDNQPFTLAVWDDGTGPALFAGGEIHTASGTNVNGIAKWDGSTWSALSGPSGIGVNGFVLSLAVYDDGGGSALYAGGWFTEAGGVTVNHVAKWDGSTWSALSGPSGTGLDDRVTSLTVHNDGGGSSLFAGGEFSTAGGITVNHVARWNGTNWSALSGPSGTGTDNRVYSLTVYDDGGGNALYAGGRFDLAGGVTVNHIAKWNGTAWSALSGPSGTGLDDWAFALTVYDDGGGDALYVGGRFTTAGGVTVNNIAKWDSTAWSALSGPSGSGLDDDVYTLAVYNGGGGTTLYAGGRFFDAGGITVDRIATWNGSNWAALSGPSGMGVNGTVRSLVTYDKGSGVELYAGGSFNTAGGVPANRIASWDGGAWSALSAPIGLGMNSAVNSQTVHDDGSGAALYVSGDFTSAGGTTVNGIAKWDGSTWSELSGPSGTGMNGRVSSLVVFDDGGGPALYAGGNFSEAGGATVNHIAKWNGTAWSALSGPSGTGMNDYVYSMTVFDDGSGPALYAGGNFTEAGGVTVNYIAKWNGTAWSALSGPSATGMDNQIYGLAVYDDGGGPALYAGGRFSTAGGVTVNYVAKWNGSTWTALTGPSGTGTSYFVNSLVAFDDGNGSELYAGGYFLSAGGVTVNYIAKWDGSTWSALSGSSGIGMDNLVESLVVLDDGGGSKLFVGGGFTTAGGETVNRITKWDGAEWSAFSGPSGTGMNLGAVYSLATYDSGNGFELYAGGSFSIAGGIASSRIAKWSCTSNLIFQSGFETGDTTEWSNVSP